MKLWLLKPREDLPKPATYRDRAVNPWEPWYDKAFGQIVRAETEERARIVASEACSDEGREAWLDAKFSTCIELTPDGEEGVVMQDVASA